MFHSGSSSSSEEDVPFNAIQAAAAAKPKIVPANPEDPLYKAITASLNQPTRNAKPPPKREPRYIGRLVEMAARRKDDVQRVSERRLIAKQREEDDLFHGKERFVTAAYREKLQGDKIRDARESTEEALEEERRKGGLGTFYGSLFNGDNVAMGGSVGDSGTRPGLSLETAKEETETPVRPESTGTDEAFEKGVVSNSRKRRKTRFGPAKVVSTTVHGTGEGTREILNNSSPRQHVKKKMRGLRRNDEKSIEEYRLRYFERRAKRLASKVSG